MGIKGTPRPHLAGLLKPEQRRKGTTRSVKCALMAGYVKQIWEDQPALGYDGIIALVRKKYECGQTAAEQAHKLAGQQIRDVHDDPNVKARLGSMLLEGAAEAKKKGKTNAMARAIDVYLVRFGHAAPMKLEHTTGPEVDDDPVLELMDEADLRVVAGAADVLEKHSRKT